MIISELIKKNTKETQSSNAHWYNSKGGKINRAEGKKEKNIKL